MSKAELIYEKAKLLSDADAQTILDYLTKLEPVPLTARALRRLPKEERQQYLAARVKEAEALYLTQPALMNDCVDAPLEYGKTGTR
jgi:hypothetical protein